MKWLIENNTISALDFNGSNLIFPWGIEFADSSSFYSLQEGIGLRYREFEKSIHFDQRSYRMDTRIEMCEGKWQLQLDDKIIDDQTILRSAVATCLEDAYLMDFVLRFRFNNQYFQRGTIAGRSYTHQNTNVYYQFPTDSVSLDGEKYAVGIKLLDYQAPMNFSPYLYLRDHFDEWVVHARLLPDLPEKTVIKLCNPWYDTKPLPQAVSNALLRIPGLKNALMYRCERKPYRGKIMRRINPQAIPIGRVEAGTKLSWKVQMKVRHAS